MTGPDDETLASLRRVNATAAFNTWAGIEVNAAESGRVELRLVWRKEFGQYAGFLHAGIVTALIDTACGFAAATVSGGNVTASHCAVSFLAPAQGEVFTARARVTKAGRRQIFTAADLTADRGGDTVLVATGTTLLIPLTAS
jgi:uncharacterized protein (TIGR00369 family)